MKIKGLTGLLGVGTLALASLVPNTGANADIIRFSNVSADYHQNQIGGSQMSIENFVLAKDGKDDEDVILNTDINPLERFFVIYSDVEGYKLSTDVRPYPTIGKTYDTIRLSVENEDGNGFSANNYVMFDTLNIANSNGVVDYSWTLAVDTNMDGNYNHFDGGNSVRDMIDNYGGKTEPWSQTILENFSWKNGDLYGRDYYGTMTLTAKPIPEPSTMGLLAMAGIAGAGASSVLGRKRKRKSGFEDKTE